MKRNTIIILDTETARTVNDPLFYNLAYHILDADTFEVLCSRSFIEKNTFENEELMNSAYYARKLPKYHEEIANGKHIVATVEEIKRIVDADMKKYNCTMVGAYNMPFDRRSTNNTIREYSEKLKYFFPFGTEFFDLWSAACSSILRSKNYIKWAIKNDFLSPSGNILTNAEVAYRYLTKNTEFVESHTALEDVIIEAEICKALFNTRMKVDWIPFYNPWRIVQQYREEFGL